MKIQLPKNVPSPCLLYTSDAADERSSVDLGGRRIIKKKKTDNITSTRGRNKHEDENTTHTNDYNKNRMKKKNRIQ